MLETRKDENEMPGLHMCQRIRRVSCSKNGSNQITTSTFIGPPNKKGASSKSFNMVELLRQQKILADTSVIGSFLYKGNGGTSSHDVFGEASE